MYPLMLELVETGLLAYEVSVILYSEPFQMAIFFLKRVSDGYRLY